MDVAREVLQGILDKLAPEDSVSIVLFSDAACTPKALGPLRCANLEEMKRQASEPCKLPEEGSSCQHLSGKEFFQSPWVTHCLPLFIACLPCLQIDSDVRDTSGTNMQAGIDAGVSCAARTVAGTAAKPQTRAD